MRISHHSNSTLQSTVSHSSYLSRFQFASKLALILFAALIGLLSLLKSVAFASGGAIPDDAIRIRIIANSDSAADQNMKAAVRDDVAAFIESWGAMPATHDEARKLIASRLPEIQRHVEEKLEKLKAPYGGKTELAKVPFPEKVFDGATYASGDYEALRITLGDGSGANWWCVLFPPLCLTAATSDDDQKPAAQPAVAKGSSDHPAKPLANAAADGTQDEPKTKFFLIVLLEKLFAFIGSLF